MITDGKHRSWRLIVGLILLLGVGTHVILFMLVEIRLGAGPKLEEKTPFVGYQKRTEQPDSVLLERAVLFDSEPLFVPTKWNSASDLNEVARLKDETELFELFEAVIHLEVGAIAEVDGGWLEDRQLGLKPAERLNQVMIMPLESLGVQAEKAGQFTPRGANIEVYPLVGGSSEAVYTFEISSDEVVTAHLWSPVVYYLVVDVELGALPPLRTNSTGDEELDAHIMDYLGSEEFRRKVGSGYFRVEVAP